MVKFYDTIPDSLVPWIHKQKMFFVATAPLSPTGHVNISPKGFSGTFRVVDDKTVWYEDLTGSGIETAAHVRENGRITIMMVAFEGPPQIMRLFGTGAVHEFGSEEYNRLLPPGERQAGSRAAIVLDIHKVSTSCGFSIPFFDFKTDRVRLHNYMASLEKRDLDPVPAESESKPQGLKNYWEKRNYASIDGLPGLSQAFDAERGFDNSTAGRKWDADDESLPASESESKNRTALAGEEGSGSAVLEASKRRDSSSHMFEFAGKADTRLVVGFIAGVLCANLISFGRVWDTARRLGSF